MSVENRQQLIVAVEGTASLGFYWQSILSDYLEKIIRSFAVNELAGQKPSNSNVEFALVSFNSHGNYAPYIVQRTGWTKNPDTFLEWMSCIPFYGGGFNDAAITEGLGEALMMFPVPSNGSQPQQSANVQKHCILVAASNPYPLPTPVYQPQIEQSDNKELQIGSRLADAEAVAKFFPQISVSLSVICPKQLPKLQAIFDAGKRSPRPADPVVDNAKNPNFLVLISESFMEARNALSRTGVLNMASNQSPVKRDMSSVTAVSGPVPTSMGAVNGSVMNRQPISVPNSAPTATVKVEPSTVTSMGPSSVFPHMPSSVPRPTSQPIPTLQASSPSITSQEVVMATNDNINVPELKPTVTSIPQPLRPVPPAANVNILNNLSQARQVMNSAALTGGASIGLQSIGQTPIAMHMSNMISSSVPPPTSMSSGQQSGIASMPAGSGAFGGPTQAQQNSGLGSFTSATMPGNSNPGVSQPMGNIQGSVSMGQSAAGMSQGNNMPGAQMLQNNGIGVNQNMMNGIGSSANGSMMPTPGGMQSIGINSNTAANMQLPQQTSSGLQSAQSKYVKVWEGNLSGQRQGQPVFITRLEGYRSSSASETLAANWPPTMQIVRLISQDHMNNKQYVGKADFLVFRAMNQHGFLGQLQEKKLCAVIQLPSQTLLLSVSDKACRLIGMLFPGDMVVFKPQISSQQQQQLQQQQLQQQQHPQLQQQQHPQLQQQQVPQMPQQLQQQPQQLSGLQQHQPQLPGLQAQQQTQLSGLQAQQQTQLSGLQAQQQPQQQQLSQMQQQMPQLQQQQQIPQLQQQTQLSQLQQQQPQLPQLQQQLQQQQMVGAGTGSAYVQQGPGGRSQGQVPSQGSLNMAGGGGGYIG